MADPLDRPQRALIYPQCDVSYVVWLAQDMVGYSPAEPGIRLVTRPGIRELTQSRNCDAFTFQIRVVWSSRVGRRLANWSDGQHGQMDSVRCVRMRVDPSLTCQKGRVPRILLHTHDRAEVAERAP